MFFVINQTAYFIEIILLTYRYQIENHESHLEYQKDKLDYFITNHQFVNDTLNLIFTLVDDPVYYHDQDLKRQRSYQFAIKSSIIYDLLLDLVVDHHFLIEEQNVHKDYHLHCENYAVIIYSVFDHDR